jgi:hypothetical protein
LGWDASGALAPPAKLGTKVTGSDDSNTFDDAKSFLDLERSGMLVVEEKVISS